MVQKLVSVIIPFYNRVWICSRSVLSVLAQTYQKFEILLIDDGSSEDTTLLRDLVTKDHRIRMLRQEHTGTSLARNRGIDNALGEYIAFLDSDDLWKPEKLKKQLAFMEKEGLFFSHTSFECISTDGMLLSTKIVGGFSGNVFPGIIASCPVATPTVMVRTEVFMDSQYRFNSHFQIREDTCLWIDLARKFEFGGMDEILASVRLRQRSASKDIDKQIEGMQNILNYCHAVPELQKNGEQIADLQMVLDRYQKEKEATAPNTQIYTDQARRWMKEKKEILKEKDYLNLQVNDNDILGERFNGYRLHKQLNGRDFRSLDIVTHKQSDDPETLLYTQNDGENFADQILNSHEFILSDVVHLHLIHNTNFNLERLPLISQLKPTILTLHDPFFMAGHCVHPFDCNKWETQCRDCPYQSLYFPIDRDTSALSFTQKRLVFQQSPITLIAASEWMMERIRRSPILRDKTAYLLPFGVDQTIFKPGDQQAARKKLGIPQNQLTFLIRPKENFKGTDIAREAIQKLRECAPVTILCVGEECDLLLDLAPKCKVVPLGWVMDERSMAQLYQACDVLLMPSRMESFGLMAVEAMSCGRTVLAITGNGTALPGVIHSPECGIAVDEERYTETLQELCLHPETLVEHGNRSFEFAKAHYNETQYINGIVQIYKETMDRHQPMENAQTILYQMLANRPYPAQSSQLFYSKSWRITQPLRALARARATLFTGKSLTQALRVLQESYRNLDRFRNREILESTSWKITYPVRLGGRIVNTVRRHLHGRKGLR